MIDIFSKSVNHIRSNGIFSFTSAAGRHILPSPIDLRWHAATSVLKKYIEQRHGSPLSRQTQLKALLHGHTPELYSLYNLNNNSRNGDYFLSEYGRRVAKGLNDEPSLLDNKWKFHIYMDEVGFGSYLPKVYGTIQDGTFLSDDYDSLNDVVRNESKCVVKRMVGGGGNDVYVCTLQQGEVILQGKGGSECVASSVLNDLDNSLVTEYCEQASYMTKINPNSANTIRAITISPQPGEAHLVAAAHRIGSTRSGVLDNFSQRGFSSYIDLETGTLSKAAMRQSDHTIEWYSHHPETDVRIEDVSIPGWENIVNKIEFISSKTDRLRYVGWDLIVTDYGEFSIIEGNSYPNPRVLQIHEPLLIDDRVLEFFDSNNYRAKIKTDYI